MPPLGGPGPRRVNAGAVKRRQRNVATAPARRPAGAPNFPTAVYRPGQIVTAVPKARPKPLPRPKPARPAAPTPKQLQAARAVERQYKSQAGAVRRAAKTQKTLGPGKAVRPEGKVLRQADVAARAVEQAYKSLGTSVAKRALEQEAKGAEKQAKDKVKVGRFEIDAALVSKDPRVQKAGGLKAPGKLEAAIGAPKYAIKSISNIPADVAELAVTTPTTLAKLGAEQYKGARKSVEQKSLKPLAKAEWQTTKAVAQPYIEAFKHPGKALVEHPVSTALMFAPTVKVPGLAAGRGARLLGKQTLERPAATLEGTTLRQQRVGSRSYGKRRAQEREDLGLPPRLGVRRVSVAEAVGKRRPKGPQPRMTRGEVERRVDEFYDASKYHRADVERSAGKKAKQRYGHLPKPERQAKQAEHLEDAAIGARQENVRRFAREFGSHWQVGEGGAILKPKNATQGHIHSSEADAKKIADKAPGDFVVIKTEGPEGYAVVPKVAAQRLTSHRGVERSKSLGGKLLKTTSRSFRGAVLPVSGKWLFGQVAEAGLRTGVQHGGNPLAIPASLLRQRRVTKRIEELERVGELPKGTAKALHQRVTSGGHFAKGGVLRTELSGDLGKPGGTLAEDFAGHRGFEDVARVLTQVGHKAPAKAVRKRWNQYQRVVFDTVNGAIERTAQKSMLGKAIKESPLMEKRILGLSEKAIDEAARGLRGTETQVQLGREVDRAYGRYAKFGPDRREMLAHNTPFLPWYLNTLHFLGRVLPEDHPVLTSLGASAGKANEDWRKSQELSLRGEGPLGFGKHKPGFLMGTYPLGGGRYRHVGRYMPFLPAEVSQSVGSLLYPQFSSPVQALAPGVNWKGEQIRGGEAARWREAALSAAEAHVPLLGTAGRVTGLSELARGEKKKAEKTRERGIAESLGRSLWPFTPLEAKTRGGGGKGPKVKAVKVRAVKIKPVKIGPG